MSKPMFIKCKNIIYDKSIGAALVEMPKIRKHLRNLHSVKTPSPMQPLTHNFMDFLVMKYYKQKQIFFLKLIAVNH